MDGRDTSPLGIPKSPSFHSGLDLVASTSVGSFVDLQVSGVNNEKIPFEYVGNTTSSPYLNNFTLTLRKDKSNGSGSGKNVASIYDGTFLPQRNSVVERIVLIQGELPRLAGKPFVNKRIYFYFIGEKFYVVLCKQF